MDVMKITHVIPDEKFTIPFMSFMEKNVEEYSHLVIIYRNPKYSKYRNTFEQKQHFKYICTDKLKEKRVIKCLKNSDLIILHSFSNEVCGLLLTDRHLLSKCVWVIWGGELYAHFNSPQNIIKKIKWMIKEIMKMCTIPYIRGVASSFPGDFELASKIYKAPSNYREVLYPHSVDYNVVRKLVNDNNNHSSLRVLVGNSATKSNNHIEALDMLKQYRDNDIVIITPLSYGNDEYRDHVIEYGKSIFGSKFLPVVDYMNPNDYANLLNSIDVAIFNNDRQQAVGNIELLGYLGAKIYLRKKTAMWSYFVDEKQCRFFDVSEINKFCFNQFVEFSQEDIGVNRRYFEKVWDDSYLSSLWKNAFTHNIEVYK